MSNTKRIGFLVWGICALFFTYEFLLRTVAGTFQPQIMTDLGLTPMSFALLSTTSYLIVYSVMQVPAGLITDRFGLKKSIIAGALVCSLSALLFSFIGGLSSGIIARMLMGFGSSFGFICVLISVYDWMPKKHYGLFIGLSQFIGTLGPMVAAGPFDTLAETGLITWRMLFSLLALFGIAIAILSFLFVKNNEPDKDSVRFVDKPVSMSKALMMLFRQKQVWLIALYSASIYFSLEYLSENEGKTFVMLNGFSSNFASYMITTGWIGYAIGCPLLGFLSDRFKRRKSALILASIIGIFSISAIVFYPVSHLFVSICFFLLGVSASGQSIGFAIMAEQCKKTYLAAGLGLNNGIICLVSSINAPVIGMLLDLHKTGDYLQLSDYYFAFSVIIGCTVAALFLSVLFIKETFCRPTKDVTIVSF